MGILILPEAANPPEEAGQPRKSEDGGKHIEHGVGPFHAAAAAVSAAPESVPPYTESTLPAEKRLTPLPSAKGRAPFSFFSKTVPSSSNFWQRSAPQARRSWSEENHMDMQQMLLPHMGASAYNAAFL